MKGGNSMNILAVIPARGGSKGIPRKNVRLLNGIPLISYSIKNAKKSRYSLDIVVSTDDEEVMHIASSYGTDVIIRPEWLAADDVTLDPVVYHATEEMEKIKNIRYDVIITMQPTSPLLQTSTLDNAIEYFLMNEFDTVLSCVNKPHLAWTEREGRMIPKYEKRLNRQLLPKHFLETGAFFISDRSCVNETSRFGSSVSIFEISEKESVDIDSPQDWWIAETELKKKNILIRVEGYAEIGLGHVYRALLLGYNLINHQIKYVLSERSDLGLIKIKQSHFSYSVISEDSQLSAIIEEFNADILINDMLDTDEKYMKACRATGVRIVNFEDLGSGAAHADAVINDLYDKKNALPNHFWGSDYYCIRDEFIFAKPSPFSEQVNEILIVFGGTDPSNLTERVIDAVDTLPIKNLHITCILGMGFKKADRLRRKASQLSIPIDIVQDVKRISEYMTQADLAISSQGRTMLELASIGVPTILMAQNEREMHHEFGYLENGFINLGLGEEIDAITIHQTLLWLINAPQIRRQMKSQMERKDLTSGVERVKNIILGRTI